MQSSRPALPTSSKPSTSKLSTSDLLTLVFCILILSTLSFAAAPDRITGPIASSQPMRLSAGVPMKARPQYDQGPVDPALKLGYMTLLTVPSASQQKAITRLLLQQQDPHSPQYHRWLTPDQYADRFGLSPSDVQKLTTWLQSQGFTVVRVARARNFIVFSGTAAQAETAFQTQIHNFDIDGEKRFSNVVPPSIPAALTGIVTGIRGLSNFPLRSHALHAKPDYTEPVAGGNHYWIAPGDVTTMYDLQKLYNAGITGAGYTMAVIGQTDVYLADLNDFRTAFDLPQISGCTFFTGTNVIQTCDTTNFQYVVVTGDTDPGMPNSIQDDLTEADIDLEYSAAVAQQAQIIYVNAPESGVTNAWYFAIDHDLSPVISLSYGICELGEAQNGDFASDEAELSSAGTYGITFMNSSGDFGATECEPNNFGDPNGTLATLGLAVSYPASSQYVTGVGGTMIPSTEYTNTYWSPSNGSTGGSATQYIPEQGWNDAQEFGVYCMANPTNSFCTDNGSGITITSWETAQEALGIIAGGGGASNCTTINNGTGVCVSGSPQPVYQQSLKVPGQTTAVRFSPDVSLLASVFWPGFIICTPVDEVLHNGDTSSMCAPPAGLSGFFSYGFTFGGTSIATPMFAGIVTLLNQDVVQSGLQTQPGLGNINPTLYKLAATPANAAFNLLASSTSTGSNSVYCEPGMPNLAGWPAALVCPAAVAPATEGFFGFDASNFDPTTNYNLVTGLGSVDAYNLAKAWLGTATASTATTVTSSQNPSNFGTAVTFTATVTTTGPNAPTGTITFYNGTTSLGTGTLVNLNPTQATATFTTPSTSPLPPGTDPITAAYGGDTNNSASTSAILNQTVNPPSFTFISNGPPSHTVLAGQQTLTTTPYTFLATPTSGATFAGAVSFGCTFAPTDPTLTLSACTFTPSSVAAGAGPTTVSLVIETAGPNTGMGSQFRRRADNRSPWLPLALPLAGIVMVGFAGRKMSRFAAIACLSISLVLLGLLVACGGSSSPPPIVVSVSPGATVFPNNTGWPSQTTTFTATVTNGTNTAVNWTLTSSVLCTTASNPCGSLSSATGSPTTYTAPTIAAGLPPSVTVTATSQADPTKSGQAIETISPATIPGTYTVTVTATEAGQSVMATPPTTLVVQ
ncbi:MAG TPA: protease pro-enzyme activation domain-containing protein [Terriglobales bacterium]